ncbi:MAG: hypothetical protein KGI29_04965 [Pseudomonadota bacterium]|nr:hypothetical protein [Pseudomonadota bacterium]MDE3038645.1 hypothetical protein [Pseudomonadota bacterium]
MTQKAYSLIVGIIFTIVALVHVWRLAAGWDIIIDGWLVPMWVSWIGLIVPGILGFFGFRYSR